MPLKPYRFVTNWDWINNIRSFQKLWLKEKCGKFNCESSFFTFAFLQTSSRWFQHLNLWLLDDSLSRFSTFHVFCKNDKSIIFGSLCFFFFRFLSFYTLAEKKKNQFLVLSRVSMREDLSRRIYQETRKRKRHYNDVWNEVLTSRVHLILALTSCHIHGTLR